MKDVEEPWGECNWYGLAKACIVTASVGLTAWLGVQDWYKRNETVETFRGKEKVARTVDIDGVEYRITDVANGFLQHGFHRMELCGAYFSPAECQEIIQACDERKDNVITGWEAEGAFSTVLNPLHPLGQRVLPLEKRVNEPSIDKYPQWFALLQSRERGGERPYLDVISR